MPNSLKSTLEYFAGKPNLASQVKLQKLDKAGVLRNGNKDITFHTIFYTMTNKGVMRWSLLTILPFVVLAIISSQVRMTQSSEVSPSQGFSITQILLREINMGKSRSPENCHFCHFRGSKLC